MNPVLIQCYFFSKFISPFTHALILHQFIILHLCVFCIYHLCLIGLESHSMRNIVLSFWDGTFLSRYHDGGISLYVFCFRLYGEKISKPRSSLMKEGIAPCRDKFPQFIYTIPVRGDIFQCMHAQKLHSVLEQEGITFLFLLSSFYPDKGW